VRSGPGGAAPSEGATTLTDALESYSGLRRAAYSPKQLRSARILWIDDHPEWVANVAETLRHLGASVEVVDSTRGAVRFLETTAEAGAPIQVVISDIRRGSDPDAGTEAMPALRAVAPDAPIIFNIADYDAERGVPDGAFAITDNVDELMHLILDALEGREG
jgi:CheY-like chemotaxis protein